MALGAARRGATLVLWDVDEQALDLVAKEIENEGGTAYTFVCDVGDRLAVEQVADEVHRDGHRIDVLVNNAGIVSGRSFLDLTDEDIERTFRVNTLAHFWTIRAFLPRMIERGAGHIVTISSAAGLIGSPRLSAYSASKHAAVGLNESLRQELSRTAPGVRTTVVCPGYIDTGMFAGVDVRAHRLVPMLRPDQVATAVLDAVERDQDRVMMPPIVRTVAPLRMLPTRVFDAVARVLGITSSMDHFVGRHGPAKSEVSARRDEPTRRKIPVERVVPR
jgi:all-trans-retinol dehydrogenase (NAD+)